MQFKVLGLAFLAIFASAAPAYESVEKRARGICPAGTTPECCEVSVAGVIATTCTAVRNPRNAAAFEALCAATGTSAQCCALGAGGIGLVCTAR